VWSFSITTKGESKLALEALISTQVEDAAWFADEIYTSIRQIEIFHFVHVTFKFYVNVTLCSKFKRLLNVENFDVQNGRRKEKPGLQSNQQLHREAKIHSSTNWLHQENNVSLGEFMNPNLNGREALNDPCYNRQSE